MAQQWVDKPFEDKLLEWGLAIIFSPFLLILLLCVLVTTRFENRKRNDSRIFTKK